MIDYCEIYESDNSSLIDAAYQAWHKGIIRLDSKKSLNQNVVFSLFDQYVFIRRMFKPIWIYYLLLIRAIMLKLTFFELKIFFKTRGVKNINLNFPYSLHQSYSSFESSIIKEKPLVSIIIPTLNRYKQLNHVLIDLENQDYKNTEIIIIDQSTPFHEKFYESFNLPLQVSHQKEKGVWKARNKAIKMAEGDYLLFLDDDSRIRNDWIIEHLKCLSFFNVDISAGVSISQTGDSIPKHYKYFRWADQLDTGNVLIKREVFKKCGLFDLQFEGMRMGDGEYGVRSYINGFKSINNPKAKRLHLKAGVGGFREVSGWDGMRPNNYFGPRPIPSVLYLYRKYWGESACIYSLLITSPISLVPYRFKGQKAGYVISIIIFCFFFPLIIIQVYSSWRISSKMLKQGEKVGHIE